MNHCVNCDFHLPQHYVAACPYCGLDPKTLGSSSGCLKPKASQLNADQVAKMTLEPMSETLLSFGCKSAAASSANGVFTTAHAIPARSTYNARANARSRAPKRSTRKTGDALFSKVVITVALITLATIVFEFRHLIAEFLK